MGQKSNTKARILQGVYEDNAGIRRSGPAKSRWRRLLDAGGPARYWQLAILGALLGLAAVTGANFGLIGGGQTAQSAPAVSATVITGTGETRMPVVYPPSPVINPAPGDGEVDALVDYPGILLADLFDLEVKTIVIDPGHGGIDSGAVGNGGLKEKDVTLDIATRLRDKLIASGGYDVILTREEDRKVFLKERVEFATTRKADLFISIHINAVPPEAGAVNYVETYYFGAPTDQRSLDLAEKENRDSDYSMGEFHDVIARIGDTFKGQESESLASSIHKHLYANLKLETPDIMNAGFKRGPFMVLLGVAVPSVLVEVSCISNREEEARLSLPAYRENVASSLEAGIEEYLGQTAYRKSRQERKVQYVVQSEKQSDLRWN